MRPAHSRSISGISTTTRRPPHNGWAPLRLRRADVHELLNAALVRLPASPAR
jgi:hypothetical protein